MKKVLSVFFALVAVAALVACKPDPKTGDGYGLVHNHYVGHATLTVNGDGVHLSNKLSISSTPSVIVK